MSRLIALLPGDGIGPEVTAAAEEVLHAASDVFSLGLRFEHGAIGGAGIDQHAEPLPDATAELCSKACAVLLGAVGGPKWDGPKRPEQGLLDLRKRMGVFANIRPILTFEPLLKHGPIRADLARGVDMVIVRELTGGLYFGERTRSETDATDVCRYTVAEIERVARVAFATARARLGRVASIDKANVLETSRLWRETVQALHEREFRDVSLEHHLIDSAAMRVISEPRRFDVILTSNMFGDILSDEASVLAGSLGLLGSASVGDGMSRPGAGLGGLYEPIHGSAPELAGSGQANPMGAIMSASMLLDQGLGEPYAARAVEMAARAVLDSGVGTPDIGGGATTKEVAHRIAERLNRYAAMRI